MTHVPQSQQVTPLLGTPLQEGGLTQQDRLVLLGACKVAIGIYRKEIWEVGNLMGNLMELGQQTPNLVRDCERAKEQMAAVAGVEAKLFEEWAARAGLSKEAREHYRRKP